MNTQLVAKYPGFEPEDEEIEEPEQEQKPTQVEMPGEELQEQAQEEFQSEKSQQEQPQYTGFEPEQEQPQEYETSQETIPPEPLGFVRAFKEGLKESATGEIEQVLYGSIPPRDRKLVADPGFFEGVVKGIGTLTGDLPWIFSGGMLGGAVGSSAGPIGSVAGTASGGLAFPTFVKESMREYRAFQDRGNDITYGEFISSANTITNHTLRDGALGLMLAGVQRIIPLVNSSDNAALAPLRALFATKYAGRPIQEALSLGAEAVTAVSVPSISQGQIPALKDIAQASLLFLSQRAAHIPQQLSNIIRKAQSDGLNLALAEQIQAQNLAYPPLQEFKGKDPIYQNSRELDRNIAAFDESYMQNITQKIEAISPQNIESTHDAGLILRSMLLNPETLLIESPTPPIKPEPLQPIPLIQNPIRQATEQLSPHVYASEAQAGREIYRQFTENRAAERAPLRDRYEQLVENVEALQAFDPELHTEATQFLERFEGSVTPHTPEATLLSKTRALTRMLATRGENGDISGYNQFQISNLIKTNRSLKKVPLWDVQPDIRNNINELTQRVDESIVRHLNETAGEGVSNEYLQLNRDYHEFKMRYDNKDTQSLFKRNVKAESIYKQYTNLDNFNIITDALETTPQGQQVLNNLRREVWQRELGPDVFNARTEGEFTAAIENVTDRTFNNLMEFLEPRQQADMANSVQHTNQIRQATTNAAETHANQMREYQRALTQHKNTKQMSKQVQFQQGLLVGLLQKDPAKLVENMRTIEGINRTRESLSKVTGGKEAMAALAKFETQDMLGFMADSYIRTGRIPYKELSIQLKNKDFSAKLAALNGPKFVKDLGKLVNISDSLSDSYTKAQYKYRDDPVTALSATNIAVALGLATGNIGPALLVKAAERSVVRTIQNNANIWTQRKSYDQKHISQALEAARILKFGDRKELRAMGSKMKNGTYTP